MSETEDASTDERGGPTRLSGDARADVLGNAIHRAALQGWRVSSQTSTQAQLVTGRRVSHILHLILTVLTGGLWAIVWIIVAARGGEQHQFVVVDEYGNVSPSYLSVGSRVAPALSRADRSQVLAQVVASLTSRGWTLSTQGDTTADLVKRNWLLPWTWHHHRITIDEFGEVRFG